MSLSDDTSSEGPCVAGWRYRSCPLRRRRCEGLKLPIPLRWPEKLGWLWPWDHDVGSTWQDLTSYDIQAFLSFRVKLVDVDTRSWLFQQKTSQVRQSPFPRFTLQLHSFHPPHLPHPTMCVYSVQMIVETMCVCTDDPTDVCTDDLFTLLQMTLWNHAKVYRWPVQMTLWKVCADDPFSLLLYHLKNHRVNFSRTRKE